MRLRTLAAASCRQGGEPIRNAIVEIWQVDNNGVYLHTASPGREKWDANFQGYGRFLTGGGGEYYFRTIKPPRYPGRTPHIHIAVSQNGRRVLTSQLYIKGNPLNEQDGLYRRIRGQAARNSVTIDFKPMASSNIGELTAKCDVVMGLTPEDDADSPPRGLGPRAGDES